MITAQSLHYTASEIMTIWQGTNWLITIVIIRLHQMHEMQTIVIDVPCLSVCLSVTNAPNDSAQTLDCFIVQGHLVHPLLKYFGHLLYLSSSTAQF